jgi:C_GCAxxG_C_C family probable redox protein
LRKLNRNPSPKSKIAEDMHLQGFNCSQAVFSTLAEPLSFDRSLALKIASPFGGGIGRTGEICGAISGALMALGLQSGYCEPDPQAKDRVYALTREFMRRFQERYGALACKVLIGFDLSTPEGLQKARQQAVFTTKCSQFIAGAVEIAEEMLGMNLSDG